MLDNQNIIDILNNHGTISVVKEQRRYSNKTYATILRIKTMIRSTEKQVLNEFANYYEPTTKIRSFTYDDKKIWHELTYNSEATQLIIKELYDKLKPEHIKIADLIRELVRLNGSGLKDIWKKKLELYNKFYA